jgi:hypothetical protein
LLCRTHWQIDAAFSLGIYDEYVGKREETITTQAAMNMFCARIVVNGPPCRYSSVYLWLYTLIVQERKIILSGETRRVGKGERKERKKITRIVARGTFFGPLSIDDAIWYSLHGIWQSDALKGGNPSPRLRLPE